MPPADLAIRLQNILAPSDLQLSGRPLCRRLIPALKGMAEVLEFRRIANDRSTLFVRLGSGAFGYGRPFFLYVSGSGVRAISFPLTGEYGSDLGRWRRRGDRIVGYFFDVKGNWQIGAVAVLVKRGTKWRLGVFRETQEEAYETTFLGDRIDRLRLSTRSYEFRRMNQPHAGPLLIQDADWTVRNDRIVVSRPHLRRTPLFDLDRFADAVLLGDGRTARSLCAAGLYARARQIVRESVDDEGMLHATCPHSVENDKGRFLGFERPSEGSGPETFFVMAHRQSGWRIAGFRPLESFPPRRDLQRR